jgi:hypothetical protein
MVNLPMQFELLKSFVLPNYIRDSITGSISFLDRFKKQLSLFFSRQKFYFQCQFHDVNIQNIFQVQENFSINLKKDWQFLPDTNMQDILA